MKKFISALILVTACSAILAGAQKKARPQAQIKIEDGYFTTPDKVRIFYKIVGSGSETLVAVHGGPGDSLESIRRDLEPLAKNRRVIYYDQRGQGLSEVITDASKLGYETHVADLDALRQHFKLEKMSLLGNSWGGLLISLYAVEHPDRVERLVLHDPAPPMRGFLTDMEDEVTRRMKLKYTAKQMERFKLLSQPASWLKASDPLAVCNELYMSILNVYTYAKTMDIGFKSDVCEGPKESVRQWRSVNAVIWQSLGDFNLMPRLGAVKAPVLVVHGVADVIPVRASEAWARGYPNARLLVIEKAGHITHVERPDVFFPEVEKFLNDE